MRLQNMLLLRDHRFLDQLLELRQRMVDKGGKFLRVLCIGVRPRFDSRSRVSGELVTLASSAFSFMMIAFGSRQARARLATDRLHIPGSPASAIVEVGQRRKASSVVTAIASACSRDVL